VELDEVVSPVNAIELGIAVDTCGACGNSGGGSAAQNPQMNRLETNTFFTPKVYLN